MRRHRRKKGRFGWVLLVLAALAGGYIYLSDAPPRPALGQSHLAHSGTGDAIEYIDNGDGPVIVLLASLGRSVSDFNELIPKLNARGYRTLALQSRGIGRSDGGNPLANATLFDYADDVVDVLKDAGVSPGEQVQILGHAFGNRVARAFAARYPKRVDRVILLAAGGKKPIPGPVKRAIFGSFLEFLPQTMQDRFLRTAFFAPGSPIVDHWRHGWAFVAALAQFRATRGGDVAVWWDAGKRPILLIQGAVDAVAPGSDTAEPMVREFGDQISVITITGAGHALLPEQGSAIAAALLDNL